MPCEFRNKDVISQGIFKSCHENVFYRSLEYCVARVHEVSNNSLDCAFKYGNSLCLCLSLTSMPLNEHLVLVNSSFHMTIWAFCFPDTEGRCTQ